jgi:hypothetical protein
MDATKRCCVDDPLGALPDSLLHEVLSRLGSRQVVQTCVLSRQWKDLWRDVLHSNLVIDEQEFAGDHPERFDDFTDQVLPPWPSAKTPHLQAFRLNLVSPGTCWCGSVFADRLIRHVLRRVPAAVDIRAALAGTVFWRPQAGSCDAGFTRRLTTLRLVGVVLAESFMEDLGRYCPVVEDLHIENCQTDRFIPVAIAISSPTLRSFVFVQPLPFACTHLRIAAPRLAHLRLELSYDGRSCDCSNAGLFATRPDQTPLGSLSHAMIRLTDISYDFQPYRRTRNKGKLEFFKFMCGFLAFLPNVVKLHLVGFTTMVCHDPCIYLSLTIVLYI